MMKTRTGDRFTHRCKDTDPGKDREEAEGDGGSGGVGALGQWQLVGRRSLPLIGQETESNEPQEAGKTWRRDTEESEKVTWIIFMNRELILQVTNNMADNPLVNVSIQPFPANGNF